jgi:hypothetical protein
MVKGDQVMIPAELLKKFSTGVEILIHGAVISIPNSLIVKQTKEVPSSVPEKPAEWKVGMRVTHRFCPDFGEGVIEEYRRSNESGINEYIAPGETDSNQCAPWKVRYEYEGTWWTNPDNLVYIGEAL